MRGLIMCVVGSTTLRNAGIPDQAEYNSDLLVRDRLARHPGAEIRSEENTVYQKHFKVMVCSLHVAHDSRHGEGLGVDDGFNH